MRKLLFAPIVIGLAFLGAVPAAAASPPATAAGNFTILTDVTTPIRTADGNTVFSEVATGVYSGPLTGPFTDTDTFVVFKDGSFQTLRATEICTGCTLGGRTGSFNSVWTASGSESITGHLTFTSGTGGFAGLHGGGTFQTVGNVNTYSYQFHFDP